MSKDSPRTSVLRDNDLIRRGDALRIMSDGDDIVGPDYPEWFINRYATINAIPAVQPTVSPDVIEIDIRAVMMERIEEAASQSPWVPPEYAMNEIISDCCSFLREPRDPSPKQLAAQPDDVAALVKALEWYISEDETNEGDEPMPEHGNRSWNEINSYWIEGKRKAEAALARVKGVM